MDDIFNVLEMLINGSNPTNYIMGDEPKMRQRYDALTEAKAKITKLIDEAKQQGAKDFVTQGWGAKCTTKDTEDFPDDDLTTARCPTCEMWEHLEEWLQGED